MNSARLRTAVPAAALLAFLVVAGLWGRQERPSGFDDVPGDALPAAPSGAPPGTAPTVGSRKLPRSHERHPYLDGDSELIRGVLDELEKIGSSDTHKAAFFDRLRRDLDSLISTNGLHAFPLISRILADHTLPADLRKTALDALGRHVTPQGADFLARLIVGGHVASDALPQSLRTLAEFLRRIDGTGRSEPLVDLCRQAYEAALASADPELRAAAVSQSLILSRSSDPTRAVETLLGFFRTDSSYTVRVAAAGLLRRHPELTKGNLSLANDMKAVLATSPDDSTRVLALYVLTATETDAARGVVLDCLRSPSKELLTPAIWSAAELGMAEAVPALAQQLGDPETDATLRMYHLLPALARIPGLDSARAILSCAASDADAEIRFTALQRLQESAAAPDERLAQDLIVLHASRPDGPEKAEIAALLSRNASTKAYDVLQRAYAAASPERRPELVELLLASPHGGTFVQASFQDLIRTGAGSAAIERLVDVAPDRAVREVREFYVARKGEGIPPETRRSAIRALGDLGTDASKAVLRQIVEVETDLNLRIEAESALGNDL